jgi:hypothetical protein
MTSDSRNKANFDKNRIFGTLSPVAHSFPETPQPKYRLQGGACTNNPSSIVMPHVFTRKADYFWPFDKGNLKDADTFRLDETSYDNLLKRLNYPQADTQAYDFRLYGPPKIANSPSTSNIENNEANGIITEEETRSQNGQNCRRVIR